LQQPGVTYWYDQFGFGRPTGIGIAESRGLIPRPSHSAEARMLNCFSGIGQAQVHATPLQIANEAATIARGGIWMRPRLLREDTQTALDSVRPRPTSMPLDQVDLHLDPRGLAQARIGMREVVNAKSAGTGYVAHLDDIVIAGKTGTAQGARIWIKVEQPDGKTVRQPLTPANKDNPTTSTPWYRSSDTGEITHSWFMGYAPAENPEVAFCVLIEYAGAGGGPVAGPVADNILEACVQHGYLHPHSQITLAR
jgi:penicillin-binding protein 2